MSAEARVNPPAEFLYTHKWRIFGVMMIGWAMSLLDISIVNISIPTLESVIGHKPGDAISTPDEVGRYLEALAKAAPDRTLTDKEVDKAHQKIEDRLRHVLKAQIRGKESAGA